MACYVDPLFDIAGLSKNWPYAQACHLMADTLDELHAMADKLGLRRAWYQGPGKASHPHYDLTPNKRRQAVVLGAVEVDRRFAYATSPERCAEAEKSMRAKGEL